MVKTLQGENAHSDAMMPTPFEKALTCRYYQTKWRKVQSPRQFDTTHLLLEDYNTDRTKKSNCINLIGDKELSLWFYVLSK